jgi:hypothetical protein
MTAVMLKHYEAMLKWGCFFCLLALYGHVLS